jgi:hypothetical protein
VLVEARLLLLDDPLALGELELKLPQRPLQLGDPGVIRAGPRPPADGRVAETIALIDSLAAAEASETENGELVIVRLRRSDKVTSGFSPLGGKPNIGWIWHQSSGP